MYAFGVSNHSPDQAMASLLSKGMIEEASDIAIVPAGTRLKENKKPVRNVLFILSIEDFVRNMLVLNSVRYAMVRVFVFASPLRIRELNNVVPLDFEVNPAAIGLGFLQRKDLNMPLYRKSVKKQIIETVERKTTEYLKMLTDNVKRGSLLNPLMTFIYTLPSSTHQTPVKEAVAKYLFHSMSFKKLESMLDSLNGVTVNRRVRDRLREILTSEVGVNYHSAFKALAAYTPYKGKEALDMVCKEYRTSDYEMKYICSIVETSGATKKAKVRSVTA